MDEVSVRTRSEAEDEGCSRAEHVRHACRLRNHAPMSTGGGVLLQVSTALTAHDTISAADDAGGDVRSTVGTVGLGDIIRQVIRGSGHIEPLEVV